MDVISGGTADGVKVQLDDCNSTGAQVWNAQLGTLYRSATFRPCREPGAHDGYSGSPRVRRSGTRFPTSADTHDRKDEVR